MHGKMMDMSQVAFPFLAGGSDKTALLDQGRSVSYSDLSRRIQLFASGLLAGETDLGEERIAFLLPASVDYVTVLHGVWRAGGIAVPLNVACTPNELEHYLACAGVTRLVTNGSYASSMRDLCGELGVRLFLVEDVVTDVVVELPVIDKARRGMILFTSGTTSKPKGVVTTHRTIEAQITTLVSAWKWQDDDVIPLFLPLHHIHGIINVLCCGLWVGATVDLWPKFDAVGITSRVANHRYTVFMAVPTIYVKLIQFFATLKPERVEQICEGFRQMRLMVSGSAACPAKLFHEWRDLTSQSLLERYGMTEIGMGLSNPYAGERRAGSVGQPLPGVQVQLFDEQDKPISEPATPGEIRVCGDNVFLEYWDNETATREAFKDGWFCTGDVAVVEDGYYRILGRSSIDIIKSGGYKLSALEIEGVLLTHEAIKEVAVIGVEDETWGEAVVGVVVLHDGASLGYPDFKAWAEGRMSPYKIPKKLVQVAALPRNAMGKVTKTELKTACQA